MNLSPHFTLEEMLRSQTAERIGIDNTPDAAQLAKGYILAALLEDVRSVLGKPMRITSGFRCPELNRRIGGSRSSDHMDFLAADFICPDYGTPRACAQAIVDVGVVFDQLIWEGSWVHISAGPRKRQEVLTARFERGRARYTFGIG